MYLTPIPTQYREKGTKTKGQTSYKVGSHGVRGRRSSYLDGTAESYFVGNFDSVAERYLGNETILFDRYYRC